MSTYLDAKKGHPLRIDQLDAPTYLKEYLHYTLVIRNLAPRSVTDYYMQLRPFFRWVKCRANPSVTLEEFRRISISDIPFSLIVEIKPSDLYEYLSFSESLLGNSNVTRALKLTALKSMFCYFCEISHTMDTNPAAHIATPRKERKMPKYLTLDESRLLLVSVSGEMPNRGYCILTLFLNCGLRLSELVNINLSDLRDNSLRIFGKGRKERIVYLNDACMSAIHSCLEERMMLPKILDKNALFLSKRTGKRLSARRIEQLVEGYLSTAGLSGMGISPHKLRHTAATLLYQSGCADVLALKSILGHENTGTTEIYTHISDQQIRTALEHSPLAHEKVESFE